MVEGEIRCVNAVVEGKFEGTISVKELLNVRETAVMQGDLTVGKLIVQPGGTIDGTVTMRSQGKPSASKAKPASASEKTEKVSEQVK